MVDSKMSTIQSTQRMDLTSSVLLTTSLSGVVHVIMRGITGGPLYTLVNNDVWIPPCSSHLLESKPHARSAATYTNYIRFIIIIIIIVIIVIITIIFVN